MMFISHDLGVVNHVSDRVLVLYLGKTCELAPTRDLFTRPRHPYTLTLLSALPTAEQHGLVSMADPEAEMPSPVSPPSGCRFRSRCLAASAKCRAGNLLWSRWRPTTGSRATTPCFRRARAIDQEVSSASRTRWHRSLAPFAHVPAPSRLHDAVDGTGVSSDIVPIAWVGSRLVRAPRQIGGGER